MDECRWCGNDYYAGHNDYYAGHTERCAATAARAALAAPVASGDEDDQLIADRLISGPLLAEAMAHCHGVKWPVRWTRNESHDFDWVARQVAAEYARLARSSDSETP